jgi:hypothetical protein
MCLPIELLEVIYLQVCADGGQAAARLRLTSRITHDIVTPYRFHTIFALGKRALTLPSKQLESAPQSHIENIHHVYFSDTSKMSCRHDEDVLVMKERHRLAYNQSYGEPSALNAGEQMPPSWTLVSILGYDGWDYNDLWVSNFIPPQV